LENVQNKSLLEVLFNKIAHDAVEDFMKRIYFLISFILVILIVNNVFALEPYTPQKGNPERKAILNALREELKEFPFVVNYLKVKDNWAWIELSDPKYISETDSLLYKEKGKWMVKELVKPYYVDSLDKECVDVKACLYKRFQEKYPQAPADIFPKIDLERRQILNSLQQLHPELDIVFVVRYFKIKNGWAWIETDTRSHDGSSHYESIDALLHKEKGKWVVKHTRPCCGEWEEAPLERYKGY